MAIVSKSNQVLFSSNDYVSAFQSANKIERAVSLVEKGDSVVNFSAFIDEYTKLMKRLVLTNDLGHNINPNMRNAHYKLSKQVQGLEKRIVAACVQAKVVPPSQDLIQMLKVDQNLSPRPVQSKWTATAIAKYSAIGGAAALAYSPLLSAIAKIPSFFVKTVLTTLKVVPQAGKAADDAYSAAYNTFTNVGSGINALRNLGGKAGLPTHKLEDPTALGAGTLIDLMFKQFMLKLASPVIKTILPAGADKVFGTAIIASTLCDATIPDCTTKAINGAKYVTDTAANHPGITAAGTLGVGVTALLNSGSIADAFSTALGFGAPIGYSASAVLLATKALESAAQETSPEVYANITKQYPYLITATNLFGAAGSVFGSLYYDAASKVVAQTAKINVPFPALAIGDYATAALRHEAKIAKGLKVYDAVLHNQRLKSSLLGGFTLAVLPAVTTAVYEGGKAIYNSCITKNGHCNNAYVATGTAISDSRTNGWMKDVEDFGTDVVNSVTNYAYNNAYTSGASVITGIVTGLLIKMGLKTGYPVATIGGSVVAGATHGLSQAYQAIEPVVIHSATAKDGNIKAVMDSVTGVVNSVTNYAYNNAYTSGASVITGIVTGLLIKMGLKTGYPVATIGGSVLAGATHGVSQAYQAIEPVVIHSATAKDGNIKAVMDSVTGVVDSVTNYAYNNAYTSGASAITGIVTGLLIKMGLKTGYPVATIGGSVLAGATHGVSQAYQAIEPVVIHSATAKDGNIKAVMDSVTGGVNSVTNYAYNNAYTSGASAITGIFTGLLLKMKLKTGYPTATIGGLVAAGATHGVTPAYQAIAPVVTQSATNGWLKPAADYMQNNQIATGLSVVTAVGVGAVAVYTSRKRPGGTTVTQTALGSTLAATITAAATHALYQVGMWAIQNPLPTVITTTLIGGGIAGYRNREPLGAGASAAGKFVGGLATAGINMLANKWRSKPHTD